MLLWKKKRHFWYVFDKDNPWCSSSEAASCNSISIFCFNLRLQQRRGPDWRYYIDTVEGEGHQRGGVIISLLTQQKHKRLLLWIKHDPSAPSLLFHRQLSKYGDARCQHAFAFFFFSHFPPLFSSSQFQPQESYFEKWLSQKQILSLIVAVDLFSYSTMWQMDTISTNGTFSFEWLIVKKKKKKAWWSLSRCEGSWLCPYHPQNRMATAETNQQETQKI